MFRVILFHRKGYLAYFPYEVDKCSGFIVAKFLDIVFDRSVAHWEPTVKLGIKVQRDRPQSPSTIKWRLTLLTEIDVICCLPGMRSVPFRDHINRICRTIEGPLRTPGFRRCRAE